jgi:hypothetical protein
MWVMALHLDPTDGDGSLNQRVKASASASAYRLTTHGVQALEHGALICPSCSIPVLLGERMPASAPLRCSFCDETAPARSYLRPGVWDALVNEAYLVARIT